MITIEVLCRTVGGVEPGEVEQWIRERWVLPERNDGTYVFHEIDVARVRLILEMRRDLAINEEAMPVVLGLLDQLYALRHRMRSLAAAVDALPSEIRQALRHHLDEP
jgi:chaperone modulatory protein CbpM